MNVATKNDKAITRIRNVLRVLTAKDFYGTVSIVIRAGKIIRMDETETTKFDLLRRDNDTTTVDRDTVDSG